MQIRVGNARSCTGQLWLAIFLSIVGCAQPSGTWTLGETYPKGSGFPISTMALEKSGEYKAQGFFTPDGKYRREPQDSSGKFKFTGFGGQLMPSGGPVTYSVSRRWDGRLAVSYVPPGESKRVTAIFNSSPRGGSDAAITTMPVSEMKSTKPMAPASIRADDETSFRSSTIQKLPG